MARDGRGVFGGDLTVPALAREFGMDAAACRAALESLDRRRARLVWVPVVLGLGVLMTGLLLVAGGFFLFGFNQVTGSAVATVMLVALAGAAALAAWARGSMVRREFMRRQASGECFGCDYVLGGLPDAGGWVRCPECARWSPVAVVKTASTCVAESAGSDGDVTGDIEG